jgi:hypothetical protein
METGDNAGSVLLRRLAFCDHIFVFDGAGKRMAVKSRQ